ncbi:FAD-dependent oxidoreductase [Rhodococcus sovatensis]|uniref:FAD-dependent oxidoreductase n=1 Tax=Rhodococcus sovatensis TaxID=1805840 RepID=A0ABZ2PHW8_9NOCA
MNDKARTHRIAVIGLGAVGSMTAWQLASKGFKVDGYDRFAPGSDHSGAGGSTRMFRTIYPESPNYSGLLEKSSTMWRELERASGLSLMVSTGALTISTPDSVMVSSTVAAAEAAKVEYEILDPATTLARHPGQILRDDEVAVFDPGAGVIRSNAAIVVAADRAEALGARILSHTEVFEISAIGGGYRVSSSFGVEQYDLVVVAAGGVSAALLPQFADKLVTRQLTTTWHVAREPQSADPASCPLVLRRSGPSRSFGTQCALDASTVKVGLLWDRDDAVSETDGFALSVPSEWEALTAECLADLYPNVYPQSVRTQTYADAFSKDGHGYVGELPGAPGMFVATGFSAHGFKIAPAIGALVTDLITTGFSPLHIDELRADRVSTADGGTGLLWVRPA